VEIGIRVNNLFDLIFVWGVSQKEKQNLKISREFSGKTEIDGLYKKVNP